MAKLVIGTNKQTVIPAIVRDFSPAYYIEKAVNVDGELRNRPKTIISFKDVTALSVDILAYAYSYAEFPANTVLDMSSIKRVALEACHKMCYHSSGVVSLDLSGLTEISGSMVQAFESAFSWCSTLTSVDLSSLITIAGPSSCKDCFSICSSLASVNLRNLKNIDADNGCRYMFQSCTSLTSIDLSSLLGINGSQACQYMFKDCTGLTSVDLSSLTTATGYCVGQYMFQNCTGLTNVVLSNLIEISGQSGFDSMFSGCTSLTSLSFPALTSSSFGTRYKGQFNNLVSGVTGCTIHFPSNLDPQSGSTVISSLTGYPNFGGTNTVLAFDLPATE